MAFLGSVGKAFARINAAVLSGGATEVLRLAGKTNTAKTLETNLSPGIYRDSSRSLVPTSVGLSVVGSYFAGPPGAALGYYIGGLRGPQITQPQPQSYVVNTQPQVIQNYVPPGGSMAFGSYLPNQLTGGNPAWHSLETSDPQSQTLWGSLGQCQGGWELRGSSVRRC